MTSLCIITLIVLIFQATLAANRITRDNIGVLLQSDTYENDYVSPHRVLLDNNHNILTNGTIQSALLSKHNEYRSITAMGNTPDQPPATNINYLFWDPALAAVAQDYGTYV